MELALEGAPRIYKIRRSHHLGYGFIAGSELPTMVKFIEQNGPSFKRLLPGDVIMAVNGIDVEQAPREQIIKMIQLSEDEIEIKVRQPTYEEIIRAKNLADPKYYGSNKSNTFSHNNNNNNNSLASLNTKQHRPLPTPLTTPSLTGSTMNRLVTSISDQQEHSQILTNGTQDGQATTFRQNMRILKQRADENETVCVSDAQDYPMVNGTRTLGRPGNASNYGRHSPQLQRCKSSMDTNQMGKGKKSGDSLNDQPMLKRSNTMRPIRPPAKVLEIFEVVIRIFFEDGHTKVLNYNQDTTVATILETLNTRLVGGSPNAEELGQYFGLVLTVNSEDSVKEQQLSKRKLLHILDENDSIMKIRQLPYASKLRLLYRMIYPPQDVSKLYSHDKVAFNYLYRQSCNDLRLERFSPELDPDTTLKLSALHIVEYVYSNHPKDHGDSKDAKLYMRLVKKTPGLDHFVPRSMIDTTIDKRGKKTLYKRLKTKLLDQLKKNFEEFDLDPPKVKSTTNLNRYTSTSFHELSLPELKSSPSDYVKLLFLNYLSQLPCYGNTRRPIRAQASPVERTSVGDCSSSMESVPRTSESSPLIKQERNQLHHNNNPPDAPPLNSISRIAQMNSMRSLSSSVHPPSSDGHAQDQIDMVQTPSIESISSITFNSPSPQQASSHVSQHSESYMYHKGTQNLVEPSPMPRQHNIASKAQDYNSIEKLYSQRYLNTVKSIDELLKSAILPPPPPTPTSVYSDIDRQISTFGSITPVLTDKDLDRLRVPPPPRISYRS